jgi:methylated-DNA-[protein]-cysteine S-methyltransferase
MLEIWPSQEKLNQLTSMPHAWLRARAAEQPAAGVAGFEVPTHLGTFGVVASAHGVASVMFPGFAQNEVVGRLSRLGLAWGSIGRQIAIEAGVELIGYLAGGLTQLRTPVDLRHLSPFLQDVYEALRTVPFGATVTYGELARLAGHASKARAVGQAMHRNPAPIFVPCHRVVSAGGGLGGWSGPNGWKERLLSLEGGAAPKSNKRILQSRSSG